MTFNSLEFLIFFPIVVILYFLLPKKFLWVMLLAASYIFYMYWNWKLIFLILFTTLVSYLCSLGIEKTESRAKKRLLLITTLVVCFGVLFFFKYWGFIGDTLNGIAGVFGGKPFVPELDLILPVGISFYTFQTLSYVIDVYRGTIKAERHFGYFALFVSFFPQLVAGPIERPENLLPQLKEKHKFDAARTYSGLSKMAVGFFKKVVVADVVAEFVNSVYNDVSIATGPLTVLATVLFAVQIYCDFSGYTDIAIGCARIMGIDLMQNFKRPYSARNIRDFWRGWHISLTSWFTDYLYIPLGGSRRGQARRMLNIMIVFLVSGLWHGARWTFVIWGGIHGLYQVIGHLTKPLREKIYKALHINTESKIFAAWQRVITFVLVCFAWMFFRANSFSDLGALMASLGTGWGFSEIGASLSGIGFTVAAAICVLLSVVVMARLDIITENRSEIIEKPRTGYVIMMVLVWAVISAWMLLYSVGGTSSFVYFQF